MPLTWNWMKNISSFLGLRWMSGAILAPTLVIGIVISANEASAWTLTADFESGTVGQEAKGASGFDSAGTKTTFSNARAHSGSKSARIQWQKGNDGWECCKGMFYNFPTNVASGQEIWMRAYFYFDNPWSWFSPGSAGDSIKVMRLRKMNTSGTSAGLITFKERSSGVPYVGCEACEEHNLYPNVQSAPVLEPGRWYALEYYIKAHPTDGIIRMWIDGILYLERLNFGNMSPGDVFTWAYVMSYWNGGAPQDQIQYVDDVVVTTNTPGNRDVHGNPMIGLQPYVADTTPPSSPKALRIQ